MSLLIIGESSMSPTPELEPHTLSFLAKWTMEIALGLIGLLTAYVLKIKGQKVDVVTTYQLEAATLKMRQEMQREFNSALDAHEKNMKEQMKDTIEHLKEVLEARNL